LKKLTRRELLRLAALAAPLLTTVPQREASAGIESEDEIPKAFGPFLDTLLPEDETPSATQLGVDRLILEEGRLGALLGMGCDSLDYAAKSMRGADFASLDQAARIDVVTQIEEFPPHTVAKVFLNRTLDLAYSHYYAQQQAWEGLGFDGPPQPGGFMDFTAPLRLRVK